MKAPGQTTRISCFAAAISAATLGTAHAQSAKEQRFAAFAARSREQAAATQARCDSKVAQTGMPTVLTATQLAADPDFSKEIAIVARAAEIVRTDCTAESEKLLASMIQDLHSIGLSPQEEREVMQSLSTGFQAGASAGRARLTEHMSNISELLRFLQTSGAKWRGPGQGFAYRTETDVATANALTDKVEASQRAILSAMSAQAQR